MLITPVMTTNLASNNRNTLLLRPIVLAVLMTLVGAPTAHAQISSDAKAGALRPGITSAGSQSIPVVNIVAPSAAGVSRNQYQQYNVDARGAILNNSGASLIQTQLAGAITGNPNLQPGVSARIIVNEVIGNSPTLLSGKTEVAGTRADVIVANPNGITVNGGGFINTARVVLTTGVPQFGGDGSLQSFRVTRGQINVDGQGLNAEQTDRVDLLARALQVNAEIRARDLNVVTGANQVTADGSGIEVISGEGVAPGVAIDVAQLGGLYANHIRLTSTESGVGVVSAGMLASAGDFNLTSVGQVTLNKTTAASGNVTLDVNALTVGGEGSLAASQALSINSRGALINNGNVGGQSGVTVYADSVDNHGVLTTSLDQHVQPSSSLWVTTSKAIGNTSTGTLLGGEVTLNAATVRNDGRLAASQALNIDSHRGALINNGSLGAQGDVVVHAGNLNNAGTLAAGMDQQGHLSNQRDLSVTTSDAINNTGTLVGRKVTLQAGTLTNFYGANVQAGTELTAIVSGDVTNSGNLLAAQNATLRSTNLTNAGLLQGSTLNVTSDHLITNSGVAQTTSGLFKVQGGGDLINSGTLHSNGDVDLGLSGTLSNTNILDGAIVTVQAANLSNAVGATLRSGAALNITTSGDVTNAGSLLSDQGGTLNTASLTNNGVLRSVNDLSVTTGAIRNTGALASENITLQATSLDNTAGAILQAGNALAVTASANVINAGSLLAGESAILSGANLNNSGTFNSSNTLHITTPGLISNTGTLIGREVALQGVMSMAGTRHGAGLTNQGTLHGNILTIVGDQALNNSGKIETDSIDAHTDSIDNSGTLSGKTVTLRTDHDFFNHDGGKIQADDALKVTSGGNVANVGQSADGHVTSLLGRSVTIDTNGGFINRDNALVQGGSQVTLRAQHVENNNARLQAGAVDDNGNVQSGDVDIQARSGNVLNTQNGKLLATGSLVVTAATDITNQVNSQIAAKKTILHATNILANITGATIAGNETLIINADEIQNGAASGTAIAASDAVISVRDFNNAGRLTANTLRIDATKLGNSGTILTQDKALLNTDSYGNTGSIASRGDAVLTLGHNQDLHLMTTALAPQANKLLTLNVRNLTVDEETNAPGDLLINASGRVDNYQALTSNGDLQIKAQSVLQNHAGALLWAGKDLLVQAQAINNEAKGDIDAEGNAKLTADSLTNAAAAKITVKGDLAIDAHTLLNDATLDGEVKRDPSEAGNGSHEDYHDARHEYYGLKINNISVLTSGLTVTQGVIQAGGNILLNQGTQNGKNAMVTNNNGRIVAGKNLLVDGAVQNIALHKDMSLLDYLADSGKVTLDLGVYTNIGSQLANPIHKPYPNLLAFLNTMLNDAENQYHHDFNISFYSWSNENVIKALAKISSSSMLTQVLSQVLGADWKGQNYSTLHTRWVAFKNTNTGLLFYPNLAAEIAAGSNVQITGRGFVNGIYQEHKQDIVSLQIGDHKVDGVRGQIDAQVNLSALVQKLDPVARLTDLLGNSHLYRFNGNTSSPTVPLYTTALQSIDQSQYYGSQYFFDKLSYQPTTALPVLADNYTTDRIVTNLITGTIGDYFTRTQGLQGAQLVKTLIDQAQSQAARLQLQVGQALTDIQVAQLNQDIVWYVSQQVNGMTVLVPQVYLAQTTLNAYKTGVTILSAQNDAKRGAAIVGAYGTVSIDVAQGGVVNVDGQIQGAQGVTIHSAGDVVNAASAGMNGGIQADNGNVVLHADHDIRNQGAQITGQNVTVTAGGTVTDTAVVGFDKDGHQIIRNDAAIQATAADGGVQINATGDIHLTAAKISGQNVTIDSTDGALKVDDLHLAQSSFNSQSTTAPAGSVGFTHTEDTAVSAQSVGSNIQAGSNGGQLTLHAKNNVELTGGSYGGERGSIQSDTGNVLTKTGQDFSYEKHTKLTEQFVAGADVGFGGNGIQTQYGSMSGTQTKTLIAGQYDGDGKAPAAPGEVATPGAGSRLAGGQFGYARSYSVDTEQKVTNNNLQLNFGKQLAVTANKGTVDIGGADFSVKADDGRIAVTGQRVTSTKFVNETIKSSHKEDTFFGLQFETHSSIAGAVNAIAAPIQAKLSGKEVDPALTTVKAVGAALDLAFGDTIGGSVSLTAKHTIKDDNSTTTGDNINHIKGGNISITSTVGNVDLNGVDVQAGKGGNVTLDAAKDLNITAAKTHTESSSKTLTNQATVGVSVGANAFTESVDVGANAGYSGSIDKTQTSETKYTNSQINGNNVSLKSRNNTTLTGANVESTNTQLDIGGNLNVVSVQDTSSMNHEKGNWGLSAGLSGGVVGGVVPQVKPSVTITAGYGKDWDNSATTKERSGIHAQNQVNGKVQGDLALTGAAISADQGGGLQVQGKTTAQKLVDYREKDGGYAGISLTVSAKPTDTSTSPPTKATPSPTQQRVGDTGGETITKLGVGESNTVGLPSLSGGRVEQVHSKTTQYAGVVGVTLNSTGGVQGELKSKDSELTAQEYNHNVADTNVTPFTAPRSFTLGERLSGVPGGQTVYGKKPWAGVEGLVKDKSSPGVELIKFNPLP